MGASGSKLASFVILYMYMTNNNGDNTHPCLTPDVMSNMSVSPSDVRTVLILFAYMTRMLSKRWPWTLHISSVCHSLSLFTLSNALSWSTHTMFSSLSCSITFSFSCLKETIASVESLPFLKPICRSLRNRSTLYRVRCSRTLACILPTWLSREMPLDIPQSLLLPFFFHMGTMTVHRQ